MERSSGILLNISSLPGEFGIGGFSADAMYFAEYLASMNFRWWQVLPLTAIGHGNSPYSGISAFAGNFLYINLNELSDLLTQDEINEAKYGGDIYLADYGFVYAAKRKALTKAFERLDGGTKDKVGRFAAENGYWLEDYALYMALRGELRTPWYEWPDKLKFRRPDALSEAAGRLKPVIEYYYFEQFLFFSQWQRLKEGINAYGVRVFGDMPIYVCYDSVDVWAHPELFMLDGALTPIKVSGVPPDYFSSEGQLWGNPLYNFERMRLTDYDWLVGRILHNMDMYDMLRIDHFRGLYKFWAIPAGSGCAKTGEWLDGPKMDIWDALKKKRAEFNIVAEDLGCIDEGVYAYLKQTGFPGMRVMQFGFDGDSSNIHLPHNYDKNSVGYTSTHDNDTTLGWLLSLPESIRSHALNYVNCTQGGGWAGNGGNCPAAKAFMRALFASSCDLAIVPMQDLCGYGSDTRMNTPGVAEGNWRYRTNYTAMDSIDRGFAVYINDLYGRNQSPNMSC